MTQPRLLGGRYELDGVVGRGGMAEVYRARDLRLDRIVAVKTLREDLARDQTFQARFRREAQSAASLNHPSHRRGLRHRRRHDGSHPGPLHRDGVRRRPDPARPAPRRPPAAAGAGAGDHRRRAAGAGLQPPQRHRAPGHQARQRDADPDRRGQGDGLRHRPGGQRRAGHHDPDRAGDRHGAVPVAGAGQGRAGRRAQRPVLGRLPAVRAADRPAPVHRRLAGRDRLPARAGRTRSRRRGWTPRSPPGRTRSCSRRWRRTRATGTSRPARCATTSSARCRACRWPRRCAPRTTRAPGGWSGHPAWPAPPARSRRTGTARRTRTRRSARAARSGRGSWPRIAAVAIIVGLVYAFSYVSGNGSSFAVPNVVGMTQAGGGERDREGQPAARAGQPGLEQRAQGRRDQHQSAVGTKLAKNATVKLFISTGAATIAVPNVVGQSASLGHEHTAGQGLPGERETRAQLHRAAEPGGAAGSRRRAPRSPRAA